MPIARFKSTAESKLAWFCRPTSRPLTRFVGIDVGVEQARVVSLGIGHSDARRPVGCDRKSLRWLSRSRFSLPINPLAAPPSDWVGRVIDELIERLPRCVDGEPCVATLSLPLPWVHYQVVAASEMEATKQQCDAMFSNSLFQSASHLSSWPLHTTNATAENAHCVIAATAETAAFELAEAVGSLGYEIEAIIPHGVALVNAAQPMTSLDPDCVVILNRSGGLVAIKNDSSCGHCRTLPALPEQIVASSHPHGLSIDAVRPWLSDVAAEITATRRYASRHQGRTETEKPLLLCGDVASVPDVDAVLATLTGVPVAQWCYAGQARPTRRQTCDQETIQSNRHLLFDDAEYAIALSLAHAAFLSKSGGGSR